MTSIVHANVVSASQAAMAALAGLWFFQETSSPSLVAGLCLTVAGMALIDRPVPA
jgi:multidrug transporter EmrE-like cation transporter